MLQSRFGAGQSQVLPRRLQKPSQVIPRKLENRVPFPFECVGDLALPGGSFDLLRVIFFQGRKPGRLAACLAKKAVRMPKKQNA